MAFVEPCGAVDAPLHIQTRLQACWLINWRTPANNCGAIFIDDVAKGDLWYFPAGHPHSIRGLGPDGGEHLLVFNQGTFSEDNTFLPSEWMAHTPSEVMRKDFGWDKATIAKLPKSGLYIFPADLPKSLAEDRAAVGGPSVQSPAQYTLKMASMEPQVRT